MCAVTHLHATKPRALQDAAGIGMVPKFTRASSCTTSWSAVGLAPGSVLRQRSMRSSTS